jgi:hypothetical protein
MLTVGPASISAERITIEVHGPASEISGFELQVIGGKPECRLSIEAASSEQLEDERHLLIFDTPEIRPVRSVKPVLKADGVSLDMPVPKSFDLDNLLPIKLNDLRRIVFHRATRTSKPETLTFIMDQVYRSTKNKKFERIEAAKILAYRTLENVDVDNFEMALARIDKALGWVAELPDEYGITKTSRYQSRISLLYVHYLICLFREDAAGVDRDLRLIFESSSFVSECPIAAYNLCLALLAAGLIAAGRGDVESAQTAWNKVIELFRVAAVSMPSVKPGTFAELAVPLGAAKQASWALEELRLRRPNEKYGLTPERLARDFSRLRNGVACSFMAQRLRSVIAATPSRKAARSTRKAEPSQA